jgi:hypothetical protein
MQKMGYDFNNPSGIGLKHQGPITPVGASYRPKAGQEYTKNPGLGLEASSPQTIKISKNATLDGVNRALDSVSAHSHKFEPVRVVGRKTARESNQQILVVAEMLKQKQAALSKLGRDAEHHPEQLKHIVAGKMHHVQSEVDDLKRAAEEAIRIAQLKTASKKLKKVPLHALHLTLFKLIVNSRARTSFNHGTRSWLKMKTKGNFEVYSEDGYTT